MGIQQNEILSIQGLSLEINSKNTKTSILDNVSLDLKKGEIVGLIGYSGSGKSMTAKSAIGLFNRLPEYKLKGSVYTSDIPKMNILEADTSSLNRIRSNNISLLFQHPADSFNPVIQCGRQILEAFTHKNNFDQNAAKEIIINWMIRMELENPQRIYRAYPHELSGGQLQRLYLIMCLINSPEIIIADEATTGLDPTTRRELIKLLLAIVKETKMAMLFISHDIGLVKMICDRIAIIDQGKIVELGDTNLVFSNPEQSFTKELINAVKLLKIPGTSQSEKGALNHQIEEKLIKNEVPDLLVFRGISKKFVQSDYQGFRGRKHEVQALSNINFVLTHGSCLAVVGESGSGKSTLANVLTGVFSFDSGDIIYRGIALSKTNRKEISEFRSNIQVIFQNPGASLDPLFTVRKSLLEALEIDSNTVEDSNALNELLIQTGLTPDLLDRLPHQLSGGQIQRVCIARALARNPDILVCDEITSALDLLIQIQIMDLLLKLKTSLNLSLIFISHDMNAVRYMADQVLVLRKGEIVEYKESNLFFSSPQHDYSKDLISASSY